MIEFVTLFLGLIGGPQTVALQATAEVASIELRLDGETVAELDGPPWQSLVDFGSELRPRQLSAVALDNAGDELSSVTQWLNVPRPAAEATVVLEHEAGGEALSASVAWESTGDPEPLAVRAVLDGRELEVTDPRRIAVGRPDPSRFHFLEVTLEFADGVIARAQLGFGGDYVDATQAALTAYAVTKKWRGAAPEPAEMRGWFEGEGGPLRVVAVEEGPADLIILRAPGALEAVRDLRGLPSGSLAPGTGSGSFGPVHMMASASEASVRDQALRFDRHHRPRLMIPRSRGREGERLWMQQFPVSPEVSPGDLGMVGLLSKDIVFPGLSTSTRLWDAAAVAVLQAAGSNRRRAVVLVLSSPWNDSSRYDAATIRGFATSLHVPLFVWCIGGGIRGVGALSPECAGSPTIASFKDLRGAMGRLSEAIDEQRVVWLEGLHSPPAIRLSAAARAVPAEAR